MVMRAHLPHGHLLAFSLLLLLAGGAACKDGSSKPEGDPSTPTSAADAPMRTAARRSLVAKGDLDAIRERGFLRVLIFEEEGGLPRGGVPTVGDRELAQELAASLKVEAELIRVDSFSDLFEKLEQGGGDLIASRLTVTDARNKRVAFTRPTRVVSEWIVGRKGAAAAPKALADLAGREVHVLAGSSYAESMRELAPQARLVTAPALVSDEDLLYDVSRGAVPLTVADSDVMDAARVYNEELTPLFELRTGRAIAWAVRKENPALRQAADAFLVQNGLRQTGRVRSTADLDEIKKRGVLRVLTRNNAVTYFLHKGRARGFDFELVQGIAKALGVRLEMVVPESANQLVPWLLEGRGDLIAASFTITAERAAKVRYSRPYLFVDELLVAAKGTPAMASAAELAGKKIAVRPSSSYAATLRTLQAEHGLIIDSAPEDQETEELIARVAKGELPFTVADSHIVNIERLYRDDVVPVLALTAAAPGAKDPIGKPLPGGKPIAFALRPDNGKLAAFIDEHIGRVYRGVAYNVAKKRYFEDERHITSAKGDRTTQGGALSVYDALFREHAAAHGLDWRLLAAVAYQESRFNPKASSWVGARGLFQFMPATAAELGFTDLEDPAQATEAAATYLSQLMGRFDPELALGVRIRFALASYNAGRGHVIDARRLAAARGLDPNLWFDNVEKTMLLLMEPRHYRRAPHGYCRGDEPVRYVREIQSRFDRYVAATP